VSRLPREQRHQELVREALRAFGARGYDGTTLEAVAEAAGVRKQTLLYYFQTKEDLFDACVDDLIDGLERSLRRVLGGPEEGLDRVESVIRTLFRLAEHWPEFPLFMREAARRSPQVVQRIADALEPFRKAALAFLERGMSAGEFRRQDPGLLLFTLYTAVVGSLAEAGVLRAVAGESSGHTALRQREQELVTFVRHALAP
jgi:TetR/AcrR family transcriptional regulator